MHARPSTSRHIFDAVSEEAQGSCPGHRAVHCSSACKHTSMTAPCCARSIQMLKRNLRDPDRKLLCPARLVSVLLHDARDARIGCKPAVHTSATKHLREAVTWCTHCSFQLAKAACRACPDHLGASMMWKNGVNATVSQGPHEGQTSTRKMRYDTQ